MNFPLINCEFHVQGKVPEPKDSLKSINIVLIDKKFFKKSIKSILNCININFIKSYTSSSQNYMNIIQKHILSRLLIDYYCFSLVLRSYRYRYDPSTIMIWYTNNDMIIPR